MDKELLAQHADGLLVLSGCLNSEVSRVLSAGDAEKARETAGWYQEVFGKDHYFMEVQAHGLDEQVRVTAETLRIAKAIGAPIVGTNDSHYLEAGHARAHEALLCIQTGTKLQDPNRWRFSTQEFYVKSAEEMAAGLRRAPGGVPQHAGGGRALQPDARVRPVPPAALRRPRRATRSRAISSELAREGLQRRYGASPGDAIEARLAHELAVIEKMGFAGYFLVVWDFIRYAREQGIAVGPGRGSSAGSLVAYCLGITNIDPMRYGLLFERFLNPERISMPDMDIDFADDRRDEVIRYVADKYGRDRVAHIITFGTLGAKAAIRDVGRVLGMPYADVDRIAKLVPGFPLNITLDDAYQKSPPLAEMVQSQANVQELWDIARALEGCTRHASVHASAVVISDEPLDEHIPLYKDPKRPELITGYAMGPIEKLGLLKMDFLGLRTLTVLANTVELIKESRGRRRSISTRCRSTTPRRTRCSARRRPSACSSWSRPGMRDALRGLRPERLEDLIAMVSLYRPGTDGADPRLHPAQARAGQDHVRASRHGEVHAGDVRDHGLPGADHADRLRDGGLHHGRGRHPAPRHGQEGPRAHGQAAREVHRRLPGAGHLRRQGRARLGADGEVRGVRLQQMPDRGHEDRDGRRHPQADHRDPRRRLVLTKDGPSGPPACEPSGSREVGRLELANGMTLRCTPDHPIFTQRGWVNAEDLTADDFVAVARELPCGAETVPDHRPALLGYALAEGSLGYDSHFYLYSTVAAEIDDMAKIVAAFGNTAARIEQRPKPKASSVRPLRIDRRGCHRKPSRFSSGTAAFRGRPPRTSASRALVDRWDRSAVAVLVGKLVQGDGCIHPRDSIDLLRDVIGRTGRRRSALASEARIPSTIHRKTLRIPGRAAQRLYRQSHRGPPSLRAVRRARRAVTWSATSGSRWLRSTASYAGTPAALRAWDRRRRPGCHLPRAAARGDTRSATQP